MAAALVLASVEIDRQNEVDVEHCSLNQGGGLVRDLLDSARAARPALPDLADHGAQQVFDDQRVTADIPPGLEAYAMVDLADGGDALNIAVVEQPRGDAQPMLRLPIACRGDRPLVAEMASHLRRSTHLVVKSAETGRQGLGQQRLQRTQRLPAVIVDPKKV